MKAIIINTKLRFQQEFINSNKFNENINVKGATDQQWYDWGFREYVVPVYTNLQKLGTLFFDNANDIYTFPVIDKTQEEIDADNLSLQNSLIQEQQANKQIIATEKLIQQVEETLSDPLMTDADVITNIAFYDYWSGDSQPYSLNKIVKLFNGELYRCVQAHTSQPTWSPELVPALFTHIVPPGTIGVFVQPTGAQDAYNIGDQVHFPTITDPVYESLINANVWSPVAYPAGWTLI